MEVDLASNFNHPSRPNGNFYLVPNCDSKVRTALYIMLIQIVDINYKTISVITEHVHIPHRCVLQNK